MTVTQLRRFDPARRGFHRTVAELRRKNYGGEHNAKGSEAEYH